MVDVALLFSGGRDSLLAGALLLEQGYRVHFLTCDNGHIDYVKRAKETVFELKDKGACVIPPIISTASLFYNLMLPEWQRKSAERIKLYPEVQTYQIHCLTCRYAMYVEAISYCKKHNISYLAEGARKSQGFFIELPEMRDRLVELCSSQGITLLLPVYDLESDQKRKRMLADRGLTTKTLEPQCNLGSPIPTPLSDVERRDLTLYYEKELKNKCLDIIL